MNAVLYLHGKGGSAAESAHYEALFPGCAVVGLDYRGNTPWEAGTQIRAAVESLRNEFGSVVLIANSIGAYYCLHAGIDRLIEKAFFISPIVDMERLIAGLMHASGVSEKALRQKGVIPTGSGEDLSWKYLCFVRENPVCWSAPTEILYGGRDMLTPRDTIEAFAKRTGAGLTVMETGEHWFHTEAQMRFLDQWIKNHRE